jgi:hypothetical protein
MQVREECGADHGVLGLLVQAPGHDGAADGRRLILLCLALGDEKPAIIELIIPRTAPEQIHVEDGTFS